MELLLDKRQELLSQLGDHAIDATELPDFNFRQGQVYLINYLISELFTDDLQLKVEEINDGND